MADFAYSPLDDELRDAAAETEQALGAFASALAAIEAELDPQRAQDQVRRCAAQAERARAACREFQLELQDAALPANELARLTGEYDGMVRRLQRQLGTLDFLRKTRQREALLGGASTGPKDADKATPAALIALGMQVQADSQQALSRITSKVEASKQVGAQVLVAMEQQHAKLDLIQATVNAQDAQFMYAERELRTLAQGALSDSLTQGLLIAIAVATFFAITWQLSDSSLTTHLPGIDKQGWRRTVLSALSTLPR